MRIYHRATGYQFGSGAGGSQGSVTAANTNLLLLYNNTNQLVYILGIQLELNYQQDAHELMGISIQRASAHSGGFTFSGTKGPAEYNDDSQINGFEWRYGCSSVTLIGNPLFRGSVDRRRPFIYEATPETAIKMAPGGRVAATLLTAPAAARSFAHKVIIGAVG